MHVMTVAWVWVLLSDPGMYECMGLMACGTRGAAVVKA